MIVLSKKDYEIIEPIQITKDENNETKVLYEFEMKITSEELGKVQDLIFNDDVKDSQKQIQRLKLEKKYDEIEKLEEEIGKKELENTEELKRLVFKEHLDKVLELTNSYEFNALYEQILCFFINAFVKKKTEPMSTIITDLQKTTLN